MSVAKVYTKTGDKGMTSLSGGKRVPKDSDKVAAYGTVDELNSFIGVAKSFIEDTGLNEQLAEIQYQLFNLGSEASTPVDQLLKPSGEPRFPHTVQEEDIEHLEHWIDKMEESLEPLAYFILPGGGKAASFLHVARTVCRRGERLLVTLAEEENSRPELKKYLNRLSDYLFVAARYVAKLEGQPEFYWNPNQRRKPRK